MTMPYEGASSGMKARDEIVRILQRFGCESVGFMDKFAEQSVILAFVHRGRQVQLEASAKGWAAAYLKEHPWNSRRRVGLEKHERRAIEQGMVAVNSILRDWVKGQITAVECGILQFEAVFMPYTLAADGRPLIEHAQKLLPQPEPKNET